MKLDIGTIQTNWNGFDEIARIAGEAHNLWLNSIELDLSQCSFFDANMAAPLYGIIARLRSEL